MMRGYRTPERTRRGGSAWSFHRLRARAGIRTARLLSDPQSKIQDPKSRIWSQSCYGVVLLFSLLFLPTRVEAEDPWADAVVHYAPGLGALLKDSSKAVGEPLGGGPSTPNNDGVVSLGGQGGVLALRFNTPVADDPDNPFGLDCIVYSNAFWTGGNPQVKFQEPAIIEISEDVNGNGIPDDPWYLIPGSRAFPYVPFPEVTEPTGQSNSETDPYLLAGNIRNPNLFDADPGNDNEEYNWGYCEMTPSVTPYLDNYVRPDDPHIVGLTPRSGGGDAFDIAWAVDAEGNPAGLTRFHFIRITSFISRNFGALGTASPEIDAVADVAPNIDTDCDGILDEYEARVAGTDPLRRESTLLPLEIPPLEGGSPPGTLLGTAEDERGTKLRLYAAQQRTEAGRAYSVKVDILESAAPDFPLPQPDLVKSGCVREVVSSESDFVGAGIQAAEVTLHYRSEEIAGLDEDGLQPYLFAGGAYTQSGISEVQVNAPANLVTFRSKYAGIFLLASTAGSGDAGSTEGPQGGIALSVSPPAGVVANPVNTATVTSGVIRDHEGNAVADGTLITVAASRGTILTSDAAPGVPGVQVPTAGGMIGFDVKAPTQSGSARITATSVEGSAYGEVQYVFLPGPPVPPVSWTVGRPDEDGDVSVALTSSVVRDEFGNAVRDGTMLTVEIEDGTILSGDADLGAPGTQVLVANGHATLVVAVPSNDSVFQLTTYADAAETQLLGRGSYSPSQYLPMPLNVSAWLLLLVPAISGLMMRQTLGGRGSCRAGSAREIPAHREVRPPISDPKGGRT